MGNKHPTNGFKKGQSGNPGGRPKVSKEVKNVRQLTNQTIAKCWEKYFINTSHQTLKTIIEHIKTGELNLPVMDVMFIKFITRAIEKGEYILLKDLFDRILGKPKESVKIEGSEENPLQIKYNNLSEEEINRLLRERYPMLQQAIHEERE